MYYVNREQIEQRLQFVQAIIETAQALLTQWDGSNPIHVMAQERALHVAVETVTDIGSYLIDGFLMRDASSYEDIIEILHGEEVLTSALFEPLHSLVLMRKPLVQQYFTLERGNLDPMLRSLAPVLKEFSESVQSYLNKHLA